MSKVKYFEQGLANDANGFECADCAMDRGIVNEDWFKHLRNVALYLPVDTSQDQLKALRMLDELTRSIATLQVYLDLTVDLKDRLVERIG